MFEDLEKVKQWLSSFINNKLNPVNIKSIANNDIFVNIFKAQFNI